MSNVTFLFSFFYQCYCRHFKFRWTKRNNHGPIGVVYTAVADGIVMFQFTPVGLQKRLDIFAMYCNKWKIKVDIDNSKTIVFRNGGPLRCYESCCFNTNHLEIVSCYKYLGVHFSASASWYLTKENISATSSSKYCNVNLPCLKNFP